MWLRAALLAERNATDGSPAGNARPPCQRSRPLPAVTATHRKHLADLAALPSRQHTSCKLIPPDNSFSAFRIALVNTASMSGACTAVLRVGWQGGRKQTQSLARPRRGTRGCTSVARSHEYPKGRPAMPVSVHGGQRGNCPPAARRALGPPAWHPGNAWAGRSALRPLAPICPSLDQ